MSERLPPGWRRATLGELGEWTSGGTPSRSHPEYYGHGLPWVKTGDLPDGPVTSIPESITTLGLENSSAKRLPPGTLLVAMYGATIGKLGILSAEAATNQACAALLPIGRTAEFIPYIFQYLLAKREDLRRIGQGGAQPNISQGILKEYSIPLPPLNEQRRIVAKLEALQSRSRRAREALDAVPPLLEKLRQSILAAAFRGDLTKDWRAKHKDVEPASELLKRIRAERKKKWEESELAKMKEKGKPPTDDKWKARFLELEPVDTRELPALPATWCWASVEQLTTHIVDCLHRTPDYVDEGYPAIRTADVVRGRLLLHQARRVSSQVYQEQVSRLVPEAGDVLYTREGERFGLAAVVPKGVDLCLSQRMMQFRLDHHIEPTYFMWALNSPLGYAQAAADVGGSTSPHVNIRSIRRFSIPVAPGPEQKVLAKRLESLWAHTDEMADSLSQLNTRIGSLDAAILAKAFRGELVPQDTSNESTEIINAVANPPRNRAKGGRRIEGDVP